MIPLTDEVETVAVLRRAAVPAPRVLYEDDEILVVDKGPHEPTTPQGEYAGSLLARVRRLPGRASSAVPRAPARRRHERPRHLRAQRPSRRAAWERALLARRSARKIYVAGARGVTPAKGAITRELREDGKHVPARARATAASRSRAGHSVLRVVPEQGRTHQIRRHLAAIGHPVLGDDRYGHAPTNRYFEEKNGLDRTFLHCVRLEIDHPRHRRAPARRSRRCPAICARCSSARAARARCASSTTRTRWARAARPVHACRRRPDCEVTELAAARSRSTRRASAVHPAAHRRRDELQPRGSAPHVHAT